MSDEVTVESLARRTIAFVVGGLLAGAFAHWFGTFHAAATLAIPLGLAAGYNAYIAVHGNPDGIKSYAYVMAGLAAATGVQYAIVV